MVPEVHLEWEMASDELRSYGATGTAAAHRLFHRRVTKLPDDPDAGLSKRTARGHSGPKISCRWRVDRHPEGPFAPYGSPPQEHHHGYLLRHGLTCCGPAAPDRGARRDCFIEAMLTPQNEIQAPLKTEDAGSTARSVIFLDGNILAKVSLRTRRGFWRRAYRSGTVDPGSRRHWRKSRRPSVWPRRTARFVRRLARCVKHSRCAAFARIAAPRTQTRMVFQSRRSRSGSPDSSSSCPRRRVFRKHRLRQSCLCA